MRILVVGGTGFLGSATARAALDAGHDVTVMSRGGNGVASGAKTLIADREHPLPDLSGAFDLVVDTCAYAPEMVNRLASAVGAVHYVLVSSISVYDDMSVPQFDETAHASEATAADLVLASEVDPAKRGTAEPYGEAYGRLKRSCEIAAQDAFAGACTVIRLGLIVGPGDYTDRFTWWVRRCDAGGNFAVPGPPDRMVQLIDVRDAADFILHAGTQKLDGVFHLTGEPITIGQMLSTIAEVTGATLRPHFTPLGIFTDAGLRHWTDLPLISPDLPELANMLNVSTTKARQSGLSCRLLAETVQGVLTWDRGRRDQQLLCGMSASDETDLQIFDGQESDTVLPEAND